MKSSFGLSSLGAPCLGASMGLSSGSSTSLGISKALSTSLIVPPSTVSCLPPSSACLVRCGNLPASETEGTACSALKGCLCVSTTVASEGLSTSTCLLGIVSLPLTFLGLSSSTAPGCDPARGMTGKNGSMRGVAAPKDSKGSPGILSGLGEEGEVLEGNGGKDGFGRLF